MNVEIKFTILIHCNVSLVFRHIAHVLHVSHYSDSTLEIDQ